MTNEELILDGLKNLTRITGETQIIATETKTEVKAVNARLDEHIRTEGDRITKIESEVDENEAEARVNIGVVHKRVDSVQNILWGLAGTTILILLGICGYFLKSHLEKGSKDAKGKQGSQVLYETEDEEGEVIGSSDLSKVNREIIEKWEKSKESKV